jgi:hypothetical protein
MPRGDGTGPTGAGPIGGKRSGRGQGGGKGKMGGPLIDRKTEIEILRRQVENLENTLKNINEQLTQLSEEK